MSRYLVVKLHKDSHEGSKENHHVNKNNHHSDENVFKELPSHDNHNHDVRFDADFIDDFLLVKSAETLWNKERLEKSIHSSKLKDHVNEEHMMRMLACIVHMELNHKIQVSEDDLNLIHKLSSNERYMEMVFTDMSNDISSAH